MKEIKNITINLALVIKGEVDQMKMVASDIEEILRDYPDVKVIYQTQSGGNLWIKEGEP